MSTHQQARPRELPGLPDNPDAERYLLGAILINNANYLEISRCLKAEDFSLEKHKLIFLRMQDLHAEGSVIDRVTLASELMKNGELQRVEGLPYLCALDENMPELQPGTIKNYVGLIKETATLRRMMRVGEDMQHRIGMHQESAADILGSVEEALLKLGEQRREQGLMNAEAIIESYDGGINAFLDPSKRVQGISTGFRQFDEMTGGLREGELIIVAARPAMGKTALALNIAQHVAMHPRTPKSVAIFSLEMSKESLLTRLICGTARVDQQRFRCGYVNAQERGALQSALSRIVDAPIYIDDSAGTNLMDVHTKVRRMQAELGGVGLVIIDYLQLMQGSRIEGREKEVSGLSRGFKLMSKELRTPFLVLSQLSRAPETRPGDHRPMLSDLRESGGIEQDADLVAFVFREEIYKPEKESLKGLAELILAKQRNGPIGRIKLAFLNRYTRFENLAEGAVLEADDDENGGTGGTWNEPRTSDEDD